MSRDRPVVFRGPASGEVAGPDDAHDLVESIDHFRAELRDRLQRRVRLLMPLLGDPDGVERYLDEQWPALTADAFAATRAAIAGAFPALWIRGREAGEGALAFLSLAQAHVWFRLSAAAAEARRLRDDDVLAYVGITPAFEQSAERFQELIEQTLEADDDWDHVFQYCVHAVRALACATAGVANARSDEWAAIWIAIELHRRSGMLEQEFREVHLPAPAVTGTVSRAGARVACVAAIASVLEDNPDALPSTLTGLADITRDLGYPGLSDDVFYSVAPGPLLQLGDTLVTHLRGADDFVDLIMRFEQTKRWAEPLVEAGRADDLERLADAIGELAGQHRIPAQSLANVWLGQQLRRMRMPERFLKRVGRAPAREEAELTPQLRRGLIVERAHAMRHVGDHGAALALLDNAPTLDLDEADLLQGEILRAILLRETGSLDVAADLLERLRNATADRPRIPLLESLGVTYLRLGRFHEAAACFDEALEAGSWLQAWQQPLMAAHAMHAHALAGTTLPATAAAILNETDPLAHPAAAIVEAAAWAERAATAELHDSAARADRIYHALPEIADTGRANQDPRMEVGAWRAAAVLAQTIDPAREGEQWSRVLAAAKRTGMSPEPDALLSLAAIAYRDGRKATGTALVDRGALMISEQFARSSSLGGAIEATLRLDRAVQRVTAAFLERSGASVSPALRSIAELPRDIVGKALGEQRRAAPKGGKPSALTEREIGRVGRRNGPVTVVELIAAGTEMRLLVTVIQGNGTVRASSVSVPSRLQRLDLPRVARRMRHRLSSWTLSRPGDPFAVPEWDAFITWVRDEVEQRAGFGPGHVVVIEPVASLGLPWHVALADKSTCSYAVSWASLLELADVPADPEGDRRVTMLVAPRYRDPVEVTSVMRATANAIASHAREAGQSVTMAMDTEADRAALFNALEGSDQVVLYCHGFVDARSGDVALMLASGGLLPLATSVAADTPVGRRHRVSWREVSTVTRSPALLVSAACSSGTTHGYGVGEQGGLYSALRPRGLRALIAPRWDIVAAEGLPVVSDAYRRHAADRVPVAVALRDAAAAAVRAGTSPWNAYAFAVQGDWRE